MHALTACRLPDRSCEQHRLAASPVKRASPSKPEPARTFLFGGLGLVGLGIIGLGIIGAVAIVQAREQLAYIRRVTGLWFEGAGLVVGPALGHRIGRGVVTSIDQHRPDATVAAAVSLL